MPNQKAWGESKALNILSYMPVSEGIWGIM